MEMLIKKTNNIMHLFIYSFLLFFNLGECTNTVLPGSPGGTKAIHKTKKKQKQKQKKTTKKKKKNTVLKAYLYRMHQ